MQKYLHVVKQGDCLINILKQYGYEGNEYNAIWKYHKKYILRRSGKKTHFKESANLNPDEIVYIPRKTEINKNIKKSFKENIKDNICTPDNVRIVQTHKRNVITFEKPHTELFIIMWHSYKTVHWTDENNNTSKPVTLVSDCIESLQRAIGNIVKKRKMVSLLGHAALLVTRKEGGKYKNPVLFSQTGSDAGVYLSRSGRYYDLHQLKWFDIPAVYLQSVKGQNVYLAPIEVLFTQAEGHWEANSDFYNRVRKREKPWENPNVAIEKIIISDDDYGKEIHEYLTNLKNDSVKAPDCKSKYYGLNTCKLRVAKENLPEGVTKLSDMKLIEKYKHYDTFKYFNPPKGDSGCINGGCANAAASVLTLCGLYDLIPGMAQFELDLSLAKLLKIKRIPLIKKHSDEEFKKDYLVPNNWKGEEMGRLTFTDPSVWNEAMLEVWSKDLQNLGFTAEYMKTMNEENYFDLCAATSIWK